MSDAPQKLELTYPCEWAYVIIGSSETAMRTAVAEIIRGRTYTVTRSHASAGGKYISLKILVDVRSEEDRLGIYHALLEHPATKVVI